MLLVIDAGNTNTVFAVFDGEVIVGQWRVATLPKRTADEYGVYIHQLFALKNLRLDQIKGVVISTVVPQGLFALRQMAKQYLSCEPLVVGDPGVDLNIKVKLDRPSEVGADRLVNAVAAYRRFGGNAVVIDFGTATTFDVINEAGDYMGGVIAPGIHLSMQALHSAAAKLPEVEVARPKKVVGTSTVEAMQSGIYWGYVGLIEGILHRMEKELGIKLKTIATGGLAPLFVKGTDAIEHLEPELTIWGLKYVYDMNG